MKRRSFLKGLIALQAVVVAPSIVLAKPDIDDYEIVTKMFNPATGKSTIGGFTMGSNGKTFKPSDLEGLHMWVSGENTTKMSNGDIRWNDMSGNGRHMYAKD